MQQELLASFKPPVTPDSFFISFEGIEGAGKSTVIKKVEDFLKSHGYRLVMVREPGGTVFGENLRKSILESKTPIHPVAEAMLFASSRAQLLSEIILKELQTPKTVVLCDRFIDSSLAYQGMARGLGIETILNIHKPFPLSSVPHRTYYISISLETSMERQRKRNSEKDYFESEKEEFYKKLISGYNQASKLFPERISVINGEVNEEEVANNVLKDLEELIRAR